MSLHMGVCGWVGRGGWGGVGGVDSISILKKELSKMAVSFEIVQEQSNLFGNFALNTSHLSICTSVSCCA